VKDREEEIPTGSGNGYSNLESLFFLKGNKTLLPRFTKMWWPSHFRVGLLFAVWSFFSGDDGGKGHWGIRWNRGTREDY